MIVAVGLVIAFVLVLIFSNRQTRNCRWRENRRNDRDGQRYYHCVSCGAETWGDPKHPPKVCLKPDTDSEV
ncbi:MAG: hypothetical protein MRY81_01180 [Donghicola eburneus]|jgi:hypothetical protein|nr:hypothetical protein [Donghicola eburneus]MCI5038273.1 hypothetical protein [Donghicola eburneus]